MNVFERFLHLNSLWITIFGVSIWSVVKYGGRWVKSKYLSIFQEIDSLKEDVYNRLDVIDSVNIAQLHSLILKECHKYIKRGYIVAWELEDLEMLYKSYKSLGGNGTVEQFYYEVLKLEKRSGIDEDE